MLEKSRNNKKRFKRGLFDLAMVAIILFAAEDVYRVSLRYLHASNFSGLLLFLSGFPCDCSPGNLRRL